MKKLSIAGIVTESEKTNNPEDDIQPEQKVDVTAFMDMLDKNKSSAGQKKKSSFSPDYLYGFEPSEEEKKFHAEKARKKELGKAYTRITKVELQGEVETMNDNLKAEKTIEEKEYSKTLLWAIVVCIMILTLLYIANNEAKKWMDNKISDETKKEFDEDDVLEILKRR